MSNREPGVYAGDIWQFAHLNIDLQFKVNDLLQLKKKKDKGDSDNGLITRAVKALCFLDEYSTFLKKKINIDGHGHCSSRSFKETSWDNVYCRVDRDFL